MHILEGALLVHYQEIYQARPLKYCNCLIVKVFKNWVKELVYICLFSLLYCSVSFVEADAYWKEHYWSIIRRSIRPDLSNTCNITGNPSINKNATQNAYVVGALWGVSNCGEFQICLEIVPKHFHPFQSIILWGVSQGITWYLPNMSFATVFCNRRYIENISVLPWKAHAIRGTILFGSPCWRPILDLCTNIIHQLSCSGTTRESNKNTNQEVKKWVEGILISNKINHLQFIRAESMHWEVSLIRHQIENTMNTLWFIISMSNQSDLFVLFWRIYNS